MGKGHSSIMKISSSTTGLRFIIVHENSNELQMGGGLINDCAQYNVAGDL